MSFTYGFYNSKNGDRKYNARQVAQIFDGLITDGVIMTIGDCLMVKPSSGMSVSVGTGRTWFNHTWSYNDSLMLLTAEASDVLLDRIDVVVHEVNENLSTRANAIKFITGTPGTNPAKPTLTNDDYIHQYPLAYIRVRANSSEITQSDITNAVGTSECPFVTGILKGIDIDDLIAQWGSQWDDWTEQKVKDFTAWASARSDEFDAWYEGKQEDFDTWFDNVKGQLSEDPAGNLQNQINEIKDGMWTTTVTLTSNGWFENKQTVSIENITASDIVMVSPYPSEDNYTVATESGIYCTSQADGSLTFKCEDIPVSDIIINVVVMGSMLM